VTFPRVATGHRPGYGCEERLPVALRWPHPPQSRTTSGLSDRATDSESESPIPLRATPSFELGEAGQHRGQRTPNTLPDQGRTPRDVPTTGGGGVVELSARSFLLHISLGDFPPPRAVSAESANGLEEVESSPGLAAGSNQPAEKPPDTLENAA